MTALVAQRRSSEIFSLQSMPPGDRLSA